MDAENPNNSIGAVAARIQERALQLQAERATLAAAQAELQDLEAVLYEEDKQNATVRRNMLITVRERHGVELELIKVHEQRQELLVHVQENREQAVEPKAVPSSFRKNGKRLSIVYMPTIKCTERSFHELWKQRSVS
jgi:hypothetical protein